MALFGSDRPVMPSFKTPPEPDSSARSPYDDLNRLERNLDRNNDRNPERRDDRNLGSEPLPPVGSSRRPKRSRHSCTGAAGTCRGAEWPGTDRDKDPSRSALHSAREGQPTDPAKERGRSRPTDSWVVLQAARARNRMAVGSTPKVAADGSKYFRSDVRAESDRCRRTGDPSGTERREVILAFRTKALSGRITSWLG